MGFEKGFDPRRANGGARPGAGRKPALATILKRLALANAADEAERSLQLCVEIRDSIRAKNSEKLEAAKIIMDRVWGRPKQAVNLTGDKGRGNMVIITHCPDGSHKSE